MTKTNHLGQPILFETPSDSNGHFEFAQFNGVGNSPYALRGIDQNGQTAAYLGLFEQAEIRALAKAILNAMEPDALVENQKDPASAPEPAIAPAPFNVGDRVRVVSTEFNPSDASRGDLGTVNEIRSPYVLVNVDGKTRRFPFLRSEIEHAPVEEKTLSTRVDDLEERVAALEADPEPALWGYKVGDLVKYTRTGVGLTGTVRKVVEVDSISEVLHLAHPSDALAVVVGRAFSASEIARA